MKKRKKKKSEKGKGPVLNLLNFEVKTNDSKRANFQLKPNSHTWLFVTYS